MDLKQYFRKIRELEAHMTDVYPVIISLETPDGGKAGLMSEVPRQIAAKMIVEGRAVLANEQEKEAYLEGLALRRASLEKAELAGRLQIAIVTDPDLQGRLAARKNSDLPASGQ